MSQQPTIGERVTALLAKHTELTTGQVAIKLGDCSPKQASNALTRLRMAGRAVSECRDGVYFWRFADPADAAAVADDPMPDPAPFAQAPEQPRQPITVAELLDYAFCASMLDPGSSIHPFDAFANGVAAAEKHHGITGWQL